MQIGMIGAGFIARALAGHLVKQGHDVMLSNSRGPQTLRRAAAALKCRVGTVAEAAAFGEVVALAIPMSAWRELPADALAGKVVIDIMTTIPNATVRSRSWRTCGGRELARACLDEAVGAEATEVGAIRAKLRASRAAMEAGLVAVHLHGAMGITDECDVGLYFKRILALAPRFGGESAMLARDGAGRRSRGRP